MISDSLLGPASLQRSLQYKNNKTVWSHEPVRRRRWAQKIPVTIHLARFPPFVPSYCTTVSIRHPSYPDQSEYVTSWDDREPISSLYLNPDYFSIQTPCWLCSDLVGTQCHLGKPTSWFSLWSHNLPVGYLANCSAILNPSLGKLRQNVCSHQGLSSIKQHICSQKKQVEVQPDYPKHNSFIGRFPLVYQFHSIHNLSKCPPAKTRSSHSSALSSRHTLQPMTPSHSARTTAVETVRSVSRALGQDTLIVRFTTLRTCSPIRVSPPRQGMFYPSEMQCGRRLSANSLPK